MISCGSDCFKAGYKVEALGQRAITASLISKEPAREIVMGLPGDDGDYHARYLEAAFGSDGTEVRVASIYLPARNRRKTQPNSATARLDGPAD